MRKFGKRLYTSPSKDAQKRFRAKIGDIVKGHKMCKQESLIRMLNPVITGWGNYYRYGASTDAFHGCDNHIYNLTKKWALRRHPKKRKSWVADKYWHEIRGRKWTFAWKYETKSKKVNYLTLKGCRIYIIPRTSKSKVRQTLSTRNTMIISFSERSNKCWNLSRDVSLSYIYGTSRTGFVRYVARK